VPGLVFGLEDPSTVRAKKYWSYSFDFLGFEFRWGKTRQACLPQAGKPHVNKRTAPKSLRNSLKRFKLWCQENRHRHLPDLFKALNAKLRGYFNYFGVHGNLPSLALFHYHAIKFVWRYLNQCSQRKSYNWDGFRQLLSEFGVVKPYLVNRPRREGRMYVPGLCDEP